MGITDDPHYWWSRVDEARRIAELLNDTEAKHTMLKVADRYEQLAREAERAIKSMSEPFCAPKGAH